MKRFVFLLLVLFLSFAGLSAQEFAATQGPYGESPIITLRVFPDGRVFAATELNLWTLENGIWSTSISSSYPSGGLTKPFLRVSDSLCFYGDRAFSDFGILWKSVDDGRSWNTWPTDLPLAALSDLVLDKDGYLLAGERFPNLGSGGTGIWRSLDSGLTWNLMGTDSTRDGMDLAQITDLEVFGDTILAGTVNGVYRSLDNGAVWEHSVSGIAPDTRIYSVARSASGVWFVGTDTSGVFRSTDAGATWSSLGAFPTERFRISLLAHPNGTLLAGTRGAGGMYRSTDDGTTWETINTGLNGAPPQGTFVRSLAYDTAYGMFLGTFFDGIYRSSDNGSTWSNIGMEASATWVAILGGTPPPLARSLFMESTHSDSVTGSLFSVASNRLFQSMDNGTSWVRISTVPGFVPTVYTILVSNTGTLFCGTDGGVSRSTDNGITWDNSLFPVSIPTRSIGESPNGIVYAGTEGLGFYRSFNMGTDWELAENNIANGFSTMACVGDSTIYAGGLNSGVHKSTDQGTTWSVVGVNDYNVTTVEVDSTGTIFAGTPAGIYRSTDGGSTWESPSALSAKANTSSALSAPTNVLSLKSEGSDLLAGTAGTGIYRSTDAGLTWQSPSASLAGMTVPSIAVREDKYVFVATGKGVYRSTAPLGTAELTFVLADGWNLLSVPMTKPDYAVETLFPEAISRGFEYYGAYEPTDTLEPGNGYWLKTSAGNAYHTGGIIAELTVPVRKGWNMIGSVTNPVPVTNIGSIPESLVTSPFYGYNPGTDGYETASTVMPGHGYWVKVSDAGSLVFGGASALPKIVIRSTGELPPSPPGERDAVFNVPPRIFILFANYPNPFNPTTTIRFDLPEPARVTLRVFTVLGEEVARLVNGVEYAAGEYSAVFDASRLGTGIYFYRLEAGPFTDVKAMLFLK